MRLRAVRKPRKTSRMPAISSLRSKDIPARGRDCWTPAPQTRGFAAKRLPPLAEPPLEGAPLPMLAPPLADVVAFVFLSGGLRKGLGNTRASPRGGIIARGQRMKRREQIRDEAQRLSQREEREGHG